MGLSKSSERRLRLPADQRSVTVPVNMDHNASNKMAANAQNLYRPLPNKLESELSFLALAVVVGRTSSSFISIRYTALEVFGLDFNNLIRLNTIF